MNRYICPWSPNATCNTRLFSDPNSAFIIGSNADDRREYIEIIKNSLKEFNLESNFALDLNQYNGKHAFCTNICSQIRKSRVIVVDLSGHFRCVCDKCQKTENQLSVNIYWEYGYAAALEKDPIILCDENQTLPFDIADKHTEFYNKANLKEKLRTLIKHKLDTPIPRKKFQVLTKVIPDNYQKIIDTNKQELYEKTKDNDLKVIFSFFPMEFHKDLFPLDNHMKVFLERKIPLEAKREYPIFRDFKQFEITQDYFISTSDFRWMGNNLLISSNGIIIYEICVNGNEAQFYGYKYKHFPIKEILNCFLGFLDFIHDIYEYVSFEDFLIISLEIENISDYYLFKELKYEPAMSPEIAKFKQPNIKKIMKSYRIQELSKSDQKLRIARDQFNPVLRAFGRINLPIYDDFVEFYNRIS